MGEERKEGRMQKPAGILTRCQEIGNATGMCCLLCVSLCLNLVLIFMLARGMHNSVGIKCPEFFVTICCRGNLEHNHGEVLPIA